MNWHFMAPTKKNMCILTIQNFLWYIWEGENPERRLGFMAHGISTQHRKESSRLAIGAWEVWIWPANELYTRTFIRHWATVHSFWCSHVCQVDHGPIVWCLTAVDQSGNLLGSAALFTTNGNFKGPFEKSRASVMYRGDWVGCTTTPGGAVQACHQCQKGPLYKFQTNCLGLCTHWTPCLLVHLES